MNERDLREQIADMLCQPNAHVMFDEIVDEFPRDMRGVRPAGWELSPWQLLEHIRIAQWDILEFSRNSDHVSPDWPDEYWPKGERPPSGKAWRKSVEKCRSDLEAMVELVMDESRDLLEPFPHGDGQTLLREAILMIKHNSYHYGQLKMVRDVLEGVDI